MAKPIANHHCSTAYMPTRTRQETSVIASGDTSVMPKNQESSRFPVRMTSGTSRTPRHPMATERSPMLALNFFLRQKIERSL